LVEIYGSESLSHNKTICGADNCVIFRVLLQHKR